MAGLSMASTVNLINVPATSGEQNELEVSSKTDYTLPH